MIDNFQRYFLMFSILIFSYFLLIRWDPPIQNSNSGLEKNNSERLLMEDSQNFEEAAPFNENLSNIESLDNECAVSNIKTLETPYWSLDIDLKKGKNTILVKACQNEQTEEWTVQWEFQLRVCNQSGVAILASNRMPTPTKKQTDRRPRRPKKS